MSPPKRSHPAGNHRAAKSESLAGKLDSLDYTSRLRQGLATLDAHLAEQYGNRGAGRVLASYLLSMQALKLTAGLYEGELRRFHMSTYELWSRTGVSQKTCSKWLRRFRADGWLEQTDPAQGANAPWWRVSLNYVTNTKSTEAVGAKGCCDVPARKPDSPMSVGHDVWQQGALGRSGYLLVGFMPAADTAATIAAATGLSLGTVYRSAARLVEAGVWTQGPPTRSGARTFTADPFADLEAVAERYGTAGTAQRRAEQVERRRRAFRHRLDVLAARPSSQQPSPFVVDGGRLVNVHTGEIVAYRLPPRLPPPVEEPPEAFEALELLGVAA